MTHTLGNTLSHAKKSQRLKIINSHNITSDNNDKNKNNNNNNNKNSVSSNS